MRRTTALGLVSLLVVACASPAAPSSTIESVSAPPASATVSQSPSPSPVVSVPPSAAASPAAGGAVDLASGDVTPGDYQASVDGTLTTFTVATPGWFGDTRSDGWALIPKDISGGLSLVTFDGPVFTKPCTNETTESIDRSASAFIDWIADNKELKAGKSTETTLAGQKAIQIDVTADVPPACPDSPRIWLWVLKESGDFHLDENEAARIIAADIGDQTFVAVVEAFEATDQDAMIERTQSVLDSIKIP